MILRLAVRYDLGKGKIEILVPVRVASLEFPFWEKGGVGAEEGWSCFRAFSKKESSAGNLQV